MLNLIHHKPNRGKILRDYFPASFWEQANVLDCASGDGRKLAKIYSKHMPSMGALTAVDIDQEALDVLKNLGANTLCLDLEKEDICSHLPGMFNIIVCSETLEHLTEECEDKLLGSFVELLLTDGHLFMTFPVDSMRPSNPYHIRQPDLLKIIRKFSPLFHNFEIRKYNYRTYVFFFLHKRKINEDI